MNETDSAKHDEFSQATTKVDPASLHMVALSISLRDLGQRLSKLETLIEKSISTEDKSRSVFIEIIKIIFGGWPALGFVFLLLFYSPLHDALNAIPSKVKTAQEIGILGVSLKSTIRSVANKLGANTLSETIPDLSFSAIDVLLKTSQNSTSLITFTPNVNKYNEYSGLFFPNKFFLTTLSELQAKGLIEIFEEENQKKRTLLSGAELVTRINEFQRQYVGEEKAHDEYNIHWIPKHPLLNNTMPKIYIRLSELGKKAVKIIIKALENELAADSVPRT